jgi:threonine dehydratase/cystathionine beta-lyase/cystathionine gamma-synthase
MSDSVITLPGIDPRAAAEELAGQVVHTPVRRLTWLERWVGVPVWAKLEFQQHTGSFKYRGAHLATARGDGRPVIAASAGNHGLAVAEAARRLGRPATICLPLTASRLKRERVLAAGARLIEHGNSLEEATAHARRLAELQGLQYLSPYNDPDVIAGAATLGLELLAEVPEATTTVVPVGGGGLASGFAVAADTLGRDVALIGCEPDRYASVAASLAAGKIVRVTHQPTFADGLAVNLEPSSITFDLLRRRLSDSVTLSEEELAAGTLALLVHESVLVEPAGAAAVIACVRLAQRGRLTGPVAIPLCGGNVQHATLTKVQRFPYYDDDLLRLLDLRGRSVSHTPVARTARGADRGGQRTRGGPAAALAARFELGLAELDRGRHEIAEFTAYCAQHSLAMDDGLVATLADTAHAAREQLLAGRAKVLAAGDDATASAQTLALAEAALRYGQATAAHVRGALDWCSPSYAQSGVAQFFDTGAQDAPIVNYDRYDSAATKRVETQLLDVFDLPGDEFAVTATSSGMAAYTLVEAFLLRERLACDDVVVTAPYLYFEAAEQLTTLPGVRCVRATGYSVDELVAAVRQHRARCLFADPLTNTAQQRMVDIPALIARLAAEVDWAVTLVVDGTMVSGAFGADVLRGAGPVEVLYYESCSKYLQLGFDAAMAGVVVHRVGQTAVLERLRRNTGAILYARAARLFPVFDRDMFLSRMDRICGNAVLVAEFLAADPRVADVGSVFHPGLADHVDHSIASTLRYAGGCVTVSFHEIGHNHRDQLDALLEHALAVAREKGLYMTKGVSFGFSAPRISAAASMAESEPPFLRIYVGDLGPAQADLLAEVLADAIVSV